MASNLLVYIGKYEQIPSTPSLIQRFQKLDFYNS